MKIAVIYFMIGIPYKPKNRSKGTWIPKINVPDLLTNNSLFKILWEYYFYGHIFSNISYLYSTLMAIKLSQTRLNMIRFLYVVPISYIFLKYYIERKSLWCCCCASRVCPFINKYLLFYLSLYNITNTRYECYSKIFAK